MSTQHPADPGGFGCGIDRAGHQDQAFRRSGFPVFGVQGRRDERRDRRLAGSDHVQARADGAHGLRNVCDVLGKAEATGVQRHVTGVDPIGDEYLKAGNEAEHEVAEQKGEVSGKRGHDQDLR